jgi:hypothetical protein
MREAIASVVLLGLGAAPAAADVSIDYSARPESAPVLLSGDGARYAVVTKIKKLGCDPEDMYDEGICDWRVTYELRAVDGGKKLGAVTFVWGAWKRKTDDAELQRTLTEGGFVTGDPVEQRSNERVYALGDRYHVAIDGHDKRVRLRVLRPGGGDAVFDELLPKKCKFKGASTIWGADVFWFAAAKLAIVKDPRACRAGIVKVIALPD